MCKRLVKTPTTTAFCSHARRKYRWPKQLKKKKKVIIDEGLDTGARRLTPERIKTVYNKMLGKAMGAKVRTYVDTCVHCGLCSDACHVYLSNDKDPKYSPAGKVKRTLGELIKKKGNVSPDFIKEMSEIASTECNVCKRCAMYCPFGIDVAYLMLVARRFCHLCGVTPCTFRPRPTAMPPP